MLPAATYMHAIIIILSLFFIFINAIAKRVFSIPSFFFPAGYGARERLIIFYGARY
jgi:hypothetical protein